ncbi:MAG: SMP-30/gluconolactonase/LRE family protein [Pseudomonadota bacterium]
MTEFRVHDARACALGEGLLWHPTRQSLYWCDILSKSLLGEDGAAWSFKHHVSALGWIDDATLLIASDIGLHQFDLGSGALTTVMDVEADNTLTRSNDGRADPWGGFWFGTMGKNGETGQGSIYRYYRGELRKLFAPITIPNAICFAADGGCAYFTDSALAQLMRVGLREGDGWPEDTPEVFLDLGPEGLVPDGAVVTQDGLFVNAQWGSGRVAVYDPSGALVDRFDLPSSNTTCPAFGGAALSTLFVSTATQKLTKEELAAEPLAGQTFAFETALVGQSEHKVIL